MTAQNKVEELMMTLHEGGAELFTEVKKVPENVTVRAKIVIELDPMKIPVSAVQSVTTLAMGDAVIVSEVPRGSE